MVKQVGNIGMKAGGAGRIKKGMVAAGAPHSTAGRE